MDQISAGLAVGEVFPVVEPRFLCGNGKAAWPRCFGNRHPALFAGGVGPFLFDGKAFVVALRAND